MPKDDSFGADYLMTSSFPDIKRLQRYKDDPKNGPRVLFFSGGTALNGISRHLKKYTHNSIHLITPFDSGGSSAILRHAFNMPAVGDIRSRLMALADESINGQSDIYKLFVYRLPKDRPQEQLKAYLKSIVNGEHDLIKAIKNPMHDIIVGHLQTFYNAMPDDFDLRIASIGNLILTGDYLSNNEKLDEVIDNYSTLVNVQGCVRAIINEKLHIGVELENGQIIVGQHLVTGKETGPITSPIKDFFVARSKDEQAPIDVAIDQSRIDLIQSAEMICYPPGSLYSSVAANLLPRGVGKAIRSNPCPKVYFPSLGNDPERLGRTIDDSIFILLDLLKRDVDNTCKMNELLNHVMIDPEHGVSLQEDTMQKLKELDIQVIEANLISEETAPYYDPDLLLSNLLTLN
ncbi:GAK system CofD-like protein [Curvivirga sp.]|uniref:GAK system CofD-like protein n=1 Tax=Curvivirga sp. TaxID=2856848 RepID=UPI003B5B9AE2